MPRFVPLRQGLLYPGRIRQAHFHAAVHLQPARYVDWVDPRQIGSWERLVKQIRAWPGSSIISHELLSSVTEEQASDALRSLDFAEVHLLFTVRDLARQIPSVWQENIKNQHTTTFPDFVHSIREPHRPHDPFWEFQDLPRILRTWGDSLPADRVHIVTVPPPAVPQQGLWQRFVSALGLDADLLRKDVPSGNASLDAAQLEVLRRLNTGVRGDIAWARYESVVKEYVVGNILFASADRQAPTLPAAEYGWVNDVAAAFVDEIRAGDYDVVGDLADLEPHPSATEPQPSPRDHELLDTAIAALTEIVRTMPVPGAGLSATARLEFHLRSHHRRLHAIRYSRRGHRFARRL